MASMKNMHELQIMISEHYRNSEQMEVITKTSMAAQMLLAVGMDSKSVRLQLIDVGVMPKDIGMGLALAMKRTDDMILSPVDKRIKKRVLANHEKMILELEEFV